MYTPTKLLQHKNKQPPFAHLTRMISPASPNDVSILVRLQTPDWVELVEHELNLVKCNTAALFNATTNSLLGEDFNIPSMSFDVDSGDDDSEVAAALGQQQQDPFNIQQAAFNNPNRAGALAAAGLRLHLYTRCFVCNVHVHVYMYLRTVRVLRVHAHMFTEIFTSM